MRQEEWPTVEVGFDPETREWTLVRIGGVEVATVRDTPFQIDVGTCGVKTVTMTFYADVEFVDHARASPSGAEG